MIILNVHMHFVDNDLIETRFLASLQGHGQRNEAKIRSLNAKTATVKCQKLGLVLKPRLNMSVN